MTNTQMKSRRFVEMRYEAVVHTDDAEMIEYSLGGAKYYLTFVDEASGFSRARRMTKGETAELLKEHVTWIERQTES